MEKNTPDLLERFRTLWHNGEIREIVDWLREESAKLKSEVCKDYARGFPATGHYNRKMSFALGLLAEWLDENLHKEKEEE